MYWASADILMEVYLAKIVSQMDMFGVVASLLYTSACVTFVDVLTLYVLVDYSMQLMQL